LKVDEVTAYKFMGRLYKTKDDVISAAIRHSLEVDFSGCESAVSVISRLASDKRLRESVCKTLSWEAE